MILHGRWEQSCSVSRTKHSDTKTGETKRTAGEKERIREGDGNHLTRKQRYFSSSVLKRDLSPCTLLLAFSPFLLQPQLSSREEERRREGL